MKLVISLVVALSTLPFTVAGEAHSHWVIDQDAVRLIENGTIINRIDNKDSDYWGEVPSVIEMLVIHDGYIYECSVILSYQNAGDSKNTRLSKAACVKLEKQTW
jgi:hypothetical protein